MKYSLLIILTFMYMYISSKGFFSIEENNINGNIPLVSG